MKVRMYTKYNRPEQLPRGPGQLRQKIAHGTQLRLLKDWSCPPGTSPLPPVWWPTRKRCVRPVRLQHHERPRVVLPVSWPLCRLQPRRHHQVARVTLCAAIPGRHVSPCKQSQGAGAIIPLGGVRRRDEVTGHALYLAVKQRLLVPQSLCRPADLLALDDGESTASTSNA